MPKISFKFPRGQWVKAIDLKAKSLGPVLSWIPSSLSKYCRWILESGPKFMLNLEGLEPLNSDRWDICQTELTRVNQDPFSICYLSYSVNGLMHWGKMLHMSHLLSLTETVFPYSETRSGCMALWSPDVWVILRLLPGLCWCWCGPEDGVKMCIELYNDVWLTQAGKFLMSMTNFYGSVPACKKSIASALELLQCCAEPWSWCQEHSMSAQPVTTPYWPRRGEHRTKYTGMSS